MGFSDVLRRHRENAGLSQYRLAQLTGLSQGYLSQLELGHKDRPSPETIRKLSSALSVPVTQLLAEAGYVEVMPYDQGIPEVKELPDYVQHLPKEMQSFILQEARKGWPFLKLLYDANLKGLEPLDLEQLLSTLIDFRRRIDEREPRN